MKIELSEEQVRYVREALGESASYSKSEYEAYLRFKKIVDTLDELVILKDHVARLEKELAE